MFPWRFISFIGRFRLVLEDLALPGGVAMSFKLTKPSSGSELIFLLLLLIAWELPGGMIPCCEVLGAIGCSMSLLAEFELKSKSLKLPRRSFVLAYVVPFALPNKLFVP